MIKYWNILKISHSTINISFKIRIRKRSSNSCNVWFYYIQRGSSKYFEQKKQRKIKEKTHSTNGIRVLEKTKRKNWTVLRKNKAILKGQIKLYQIKISQE